MSDEILIVKWSEMEPVLHPPVEESEDSRDVVDPYVAETLYEEHIARNIEARGGMASTSDWPAWDELPDMGRVYWMGLAVAARLASKAALVGFHPQPTESPEVPT